MPIKDFPPPLLIGSTTTYNESPQLFFCRLVPGGRARTWESVRSISGFPKHGYFPQRNPLCPPTLFRESLVSHGTNQDQQALKKSLTATGLGLSGSCRDMLRTERVFSDLRSRRTYWNCCGPASEIAQHFHQHFHQHIWWDLLELKKRPLGSHPRGPVPSLDASSPSS